MARSIKKGPYVEASLQKKVEQAAAGGSKQIIRTWSRRSMITPEMVAMNLRRVIGIFELPPILR